MTAMLRRLLIVMLAFAVVLLGSPGIAGAAPSHDMAAVQAMGGDCVCPPDHEMPGQDDADSCAPSLGCMIQCGMAPMGVQPDNARILLPVPARTVLFAELPGPVTSSSFPPFRPPQL